MPSTGPGFLGIVMLDTRFPRPPGDIGNPITFERAGIAHRYRVVAGASPKRIVEEADPMWLQPFIDAARSLVDSGARLISTSCGFLAAYQDALSRALPVPVISSSLLQCRRYARPGIVTIDAAALAPHILRAAGVRPGTPVEGVAPGCEFQRRILGNDSVLDPDEAGRNVVDAARALIARDPSITDIVLECTNMPPYRSLVSRATGRPVLDIETLLIAAWHDLQRQT